MSLYTKKQTPPPQSPITQRVALSVDVVVAIAGVVAVVVDAADVVHPTQNVHHG